MLKLPFYGRAGVSWCWLVDPVALTLEVFRNTDAGWLLAATHADPEASVRAAPFEAVELPIGRFWLRPDPG